MPNEDDVAAFDLELNLSNRSVLHRLERPRDLNFWPVRVSDDIRLIVHRTATSVLLCYVGHHDIAYARAERRRIELDPEAPVGLFEYVGITQYLADLFPVRVDVANRSSLKPLVRPSFERDALYAF